MANWKCTYASSNCGWDKPLYMAVTLVGESPRAVLARLRADDPLWGRDVTLLESKETDEAVTPPGQWEVKMLDSPPGMSDCR